MYRFINFKSFADATLDLDRSPVTILVGRNGAGKSNAFEALAVLGGLAASIPVFEMVGKDGGRLGTVRGGLGWAVRAGQTETTLAVSEAAGGNSLTYSVTVKVPKPDGAKSTPSIVAEELTANGVRLLQAKQRGKGILRVKFEAEDNKVKQINVGATATVLVDAAEGGTLPASPRLRASATAAMALAAVPLVLHPDPRAMREYCQFGETQLAPDASNLAAVLYALTRPKTGDPEAMNRITAALRALPEEPFVAIKAIRTAMGDCTFGLADERDRILWGARLLSDGTLRALAILVALETTSPGAVLAIEEFDDAVHPARAAELSAVIWECAERRGLKVLVSTHNVATLNALTAKQLRGVVLCWWDAKTAASQLRHLTDLPSPEAFVSPGHLGDDVTAERYRAHLLPDAEFAALREKAVAATFARLRQLRTGQEVG